MSRREILMHLAWLSIVVYFAVAAIGRSGGTVRQYEVKLGMTPDQLAAYVAGGVLFGFVGVVIGWAFGRYHGYTLGVREHSRPFTRVEP